MYRILIAVKNNFGKEGPLQLNCLHTFVKFYLARNKIKLRGQGALLGVLKHFMVALGNRHSL